MTISDISGHLLADWVPSLPAAVGSSFIGWPPFLIELLNLSSTYSRAADVSVREAEHDPRGALWRRLAGCSIDTFGRDQL
jgi:hypothetical protein